MKILIWADFVCPFCYIGAANLDKAIADFEKDSEVNIEIEYKSYQLDPDGQYNPAKNYREDLADRKGVSIAQITQSIAEIELMAKEAGLNYNYNVMKNGNTLSAHRVFQYAKSQGQGSEYFKRWYAAIFSEGALVSDYETIVRLSEEIGLDQSAVKNILANPADYKTEVMTDIAQARQIGVQAVPFFVFANKYTVPGAQSVEIFSQVLKRVYQDSV